MKSRLFTLTSLLLLVTTSCAVANEGIKPTITPSFFTSSQSITVSYDVTGTPLAGLTDAYAWVWIPGASIDAKWNVNPASTDPAKSENAKFTKTTVDGRTLFTLTFIPADFFASNISTQQKMGILLKGNDWSNGQTTDHVVDFWDNTFQLRLKTPERLQLFVVDQDVVSVSAETPVDAAFSLYVNDVLLDQQSATTTYEYEYTVASLSGTLNVRLTATDGVATKEITFQLIPSQESTVASRPVGVIPGINYQQDQTRVTLCLWAPQKSSVYAVGDFNNWTISTDYLMKRDGEYFWIEVTGLTPNQEYAFQYLVDETLYVADPYSDKILDPDDSFILTSSYPGLKSYPQAARRAAWYENRAAVFQTGQVPYEWQFADYQRPDQKELIVYEILLRDFFGEGARNYQSLIDTLSYIKRLGVNAIELMPVMEFNGNEGWGYNPTFMFAPDKNYGTKKKLKELIDRCHELGLAVILDIALNHQDVPNTYAAMYFDFDSFKPANNPWFNTDATHPFNVFFDMNHESLYTQQYVDTVNHYWLNEYKIDGFRFDLSKGFTQKNSGSDVNSWSQYDATRVALLKRMADKIWSHSPHAYIILEHLGENNEERELATYRAAEGKGMMLWGKMTDPYNQNTMGYSNDAGIAGVYHKSRSWSYPHLVGYMESHDEERLMYKNIRFGKNTPEYNVQNTNTALRRMETAFANFLTVPGPKMMWQFGEYGYDQSINRCSNGTTSTDCRLTPKPVMWSYLENPDRLRLFEGVSDLLRLRRDYSIFRNGDATFVEGVGSIKEISLKNSPYTTTPSDSSEMNVHIVSNFDVTVRTVLASFPHTGTWYDYANGGIVVHVTAIPHELQIAPGAYSLFTDVPISMNVVTGVVESKREAIQVFPNPGSGIVNFSSAVRHVSVCDVSGQSIAFDWVSEQQIEIRTPGIYMLKMIVGGRIQVAKVIVQ